MKRSNLHHQTVQIRVRLFLLGMVVLILGCTICCPKVQASVRQPEKNGRMLPNTVRGAEADSSYRIELSVGVKGKFQDLNHVPVKAAITNESPVQLDGYFIFQINTDMNAAYPGEYTIWNKLFPGVRHAGDEKKGNVCYRYPISLRSGETIQKIFLTGLTGNAYHSCTVSLENGEGMIVYSENKSVSTADYQDFRIQTAVVEEDGTTSALLNGTSVLNDQYDICAFSLSPEELDETIAASYVPDVLIFVDSSMEDLSEEQKSAVERWEQNGGLLLNLSGNGNYLEGQREAFQKDPKTYLQTFLDADTIGQMMTRKDSYFQEYYSVTGLLENTEIRSNPKVGFLLIFILVYLVLVGPGLYLILKKKGKREYLWLCIGLSSFVFLIPLQIAGKKTRIQAPVITYVEEIRQGEKNNQETVNFCIQAPFHSDYELYLDPDYSVVSMQSLDYSDSYEEAVSKEDTSSEQIRMTFEDSQSKVLFSGMPTFAMNDFSMEKTTERKEGEGLFSSFHYFDGKLSGTIDNKTGYELKDCILLLPGSFVLIGDLTSGESRTVSDVSAVSSRTSDSWKKILASSKAEQDYLDSMSYMEPVSRRGDCVLLAKINGKKGKYFMDSGYEQHGFSFYFARTAVDMEEDQVTYCPYAQEYIAAEGEYPDLQTTPFSFGISGKETEVTYYLNLIFEDGGIWNQYQSYAEQKGEKGWEEDPLLSRGFWLSAMEEQKDVLQSLNCRISEFERGEILSVEFRMPEENKDREFHVFDGTIYLFNYETGEYDKLTDNILDFSHQKQLRGQYLRGNQLKVKYEIPEEETEGEYYREYGYYEAPELIVKGKEYPLEQYLGMVFEQDPESIAVQEKAGE